GQGDVHLAKVTSRLHPHLDILTIVITFEFNIGTKICCSEGAGVGEAIYQWWVQ
ncbi:hypothetical protein ZWY2020_034605, partial [Hordeum vulgare]